MNNQDLAVTITRLETKLDLMHEDQKERREDFKDIKPRLRDVENEQSKQGETQKTHKKITLGAIMALITTAIVEVSDYITTP